MGVVHGGGWFIRSSHVALIYSPKPRIYFIHYAFPGAEFSCELLKLKPLVLVPRVPLEQPPLWQASRVSSLRTSIKD